MPPRLTLYAWLLAPVALLAYHFGPGQAHMQRDEAARQIVVAEQAVKSVLVEVWGDQLEAA